MNIQEDSRTLACFYPDAEARQQVHYHFAHRFLPSYAHKNPFSFVSHDFTMPDRFIHARWQMFEQMSGLQPFSNPLAGQMNFRHVTDLTAWALDVAERPALFVQMPAPEWPACAVFIGVVLLAPIAPFLAVQVAMQDHIDRSGPRPDESLFAPLRPALCRCFTLERSASLPSDQARQFGHFCEWTREGEHRSTGAYLPLTREAFADAIARSLALGAEVPAVASSNPQENVIRFSPPMPPQQPPPLLPHPPA